MTSFGIKNSGIQPRKGKIHMKNLIKFLLEAPPEDENKPEESSMLDCVLGVITLASLMLMLFVIVPILFG